MLDLPKADSHHSIPVGPQLNSDELRVRNANYDANTLLARVRDLFDRDDQLLGHVVQHSVLVKSSQLNFSDTQHALTRIDVLPKSTVAPQAKTVDYGTLVFVTETFNREELLLRLKGVLQKQFTVGDRILTSGALGFSDSYEPSQSYSDWPCRIFDIAFGSAQLSYEPLLHPVHKVYSSTFDAIQEFLGLERFNGSSDSRLGHIHIRVPNLNARIARLNLAANRLCIAIEGVARPGSLKLSVTYKTDQQSRTLEEEVDQDVVTIDLSFLPETLSAFLVSKAGFLADFHDENRHYSTGANRVLAKTKEEYGPSVLNHWSSVEGAFPSNSNLTTAQPSSAPRTDPLLNIPDKGKFEQDLARVRGAASAEHPLSLLFVDVDHFKSVNDTYGHETGDEVLKQVALALVNGCAHKGTVYRIGGEEIGILLPNYSSAEAEVLAERLRQQVSTIRNKQKPPEITVSIGAATFPEPVRDPSELFAAADRAMYTAKQSGRNQVRTASGDAKQPDAVPFTQQALSVYMRTDELVRRLDEEIAKSSGQPLIHAEDASLHVFEKAQRLGLSSIAELAGLVREYGDTARNLARCMVPTTPISAGQSLAFVLDIAAAQQGEQALRAYFRSLRNTTTAEEYVAELLQTLSLLRE